MKYNLPKTNGDIVREKSNKDLALFLATLTIFHKVCPPPYKYNDKCPYTDCFVCWYDWLGMEAKDE